MKKIFVLLLVLAPVLYAQDDNYGPTLTTGRTATLGVEASTTFAWDIENNTSGLETKVGLELIFDLFPAADRGTPPVDNPNEPTVRLLLKDAAFTWWNTYSTSGGNYEQDDFNRWQAKPLILTFDTFIADLVWQNYFFRVASSTTLMRVNTIGLRSIFDDVMDVNDRFYYSESQALWRTERYNIQKFPILGSRLHRNYADMDLRDYTSGILAGGAEFDTFGFTLKAASFAKGTENEDNAWVFGADIEVVPFDDFKIDVTGLATINYDKTPLAENYLSFGTLFQYQIALTDNFILTPFAGFDFIYEREAEETLWEIGAGVILYTRGYDNRESYRVLDYANVIPVGASFGMNVDSDSHVNIVLSWFDPAGRNSLIENFGGFLQLEIGNLLGKDDESLDFAILTQLEYVIKEKITPYIRGGYKPELISGGGTTGDMIITTDFGLYLTPAHFFSLDLRFAMNHLLTTEEFISDKGLFSAMFTIRM